MLAYAANRSRIAERRSSPRTLLLIAVAHVALIGAVMSARMDLPPRIFPKPIVVTPIPIPEPPPPDPVEQRTQTETKTTIDQPPIIVPLPQPTNDGPIKVLNPPITGSEVIGLPPRGDPLPILDPVRIGPRFATPPSLVRPPYPPSKLDREEEAVLKLKLTIDAGGRVVAVDPVGRADPAFLAAARRHLLAHWRYRPATEDGRAIAAATVITLRFELDE